MKKLNLAVCKIEIFGGNNLVDDENH